MLTNTNILIVSLLTIIITIQYVCSTNSKLLSDETDDENTLKQALYLVKLLKTDYMKSLRAGEIDANNQEDNSTCPEDALNSTTPINSSPASGPQTATMPRVTKSPLTLPAPPVMLPQAMIPAIPKPIAAPQAPQPPPPPPPYAPAAPPMGLPYAALTPPAVLQIAQQENFKYPYRFYRRRMMPEYYYYDVQMPKYKTYLEDDARTRAITARRYIDKKYQHEHTATANASQTTLSLLPGRRRAGVDDPTTIETTPTTLETSNSPSSGIEITSTTTAADLKYQSTAAQSQSTAAQSQSTATQSRSTATQSRSTATQSQATLEYQSTAALKSQSSLIEEAKEDEKISSTVTQSIEKMPTYTLTKYVTKNTMHSKNIHEKRSQHKTSGVTKAHLKHAKKVKATTGEKPVSEDVVLSQVASELINEIKGTKTENISALLRNNENKNIIKQKLKTVTHKKSTMKIYLQGSSRIQIPFPENNAFCHLYPQSKLCGAGI